MPEKDHGGTQEDGGPVLSDDHFDRLRKADPRDLTRQEREALVDALKERDKGTARYTALESERFLDELFRIRTGMGEARHGVGQ